jgi:hypothetical protein
MQSCVCQSPPEPDFEVISFSDDNLAKALETSYFHREFIKKNKFHFKFLIEYLGNHTKDSLNAKTIVLERNYLSRDHLYDFSNYYCLCFNDGYSKKCNRIHFFNIEFSKDVFLDEILNNKNIFINQENYLGYVVTKNLPNVLIGNTLLRTYNTQNRYFISRSYDIHFFGREMHLETLPFQEQDKAVGACATSALWVAFHKTSSLFHTPLLTPFEITNSVSNLFNTTGRILPNNGLDYFQIGNAIKNSGLVFELRNKQSYVENSLKSKSFIYSYLRMGLPVLLGINIDNIGRHLVTISGYTIKTKGLNTKGDFPLYSDSLDMFYSHDDQIGPFSRFKFTTKKKKFNIETSWWRNQNDSKKLNAQLVSLIVPIYDKIRISFDDIYKLTLHLNDYFSLVITSRNFVWDIFLYQSNKYKKEISENNLIDNSIKSKILFSSLPKYIWISRLIINRKTIIEFLFDSTGIAKGFYGLSINCYVPELRERILEDIEDGVIEKLISISVGPNYYKHFISEFI